MTGEEYGDYAPCIDCGQTNLSAGWIVVLVFFGVLFLAWAVMGRQDK